MKVEILGCSGGIGVGLRTTSLLIDSDVLIDAGTGVGDLALGEMKKIRHLFLTHTHLDHIISLSFMADNFITSPGDHLNVYALPESIEILKRHVMNWDVWPDFTKLPTSSDPVICFHSLQPGKEVVIDGRTFEMVPVNHVVPAVGYYVKSKRGSFAFTGDTTTNDTFWNFLNEREPVDQLIAECSFLKKDREISVISRHYDSGLLAADLEKLNYQTLVKITHLKPGIEYEIMEECKSEMPGIAIQRLERGEVLDL